MVVITIIIIAITNLIALKRFLWKDILMWHVWKLFKWPIHVTYWLNWSFPWKMLTILKTLTYSTQIQVKCLLPSSSAQLMNPEWHLLRPHPQQRINSFISQNVRSYLIGLLLLLLHRARFSCLGDTWSKLLGNVLMDHSV